MCRYARLYNLIQFFDEESLLPPPFTLLTLFMYLMTGIAKSNCWQKGNNIIIVQQLILGKLLGTSVALKKNSNAILAYINGCCFVDKLLFNFMSLELDIQKFKGKVWLPTLKESVTLTGSQTFLFHKGMMHRQKIFLVQEINL